VAEVRSLLFLDASVLVAAAHSPTGGSALVLEICAGSRFRGALTLKVLLEARHNIQDRPALSEAEGFGEAELLRFYRQLGALEPLMVSPPSAGRLKLCAGVTAEKDAHVLAAALDSRADYLLTLDRRHFLTPAVHAFAAPMRIATPGDFLQTLLP